MKFRKVSDESAAVDMTPMLDIVFIMLIFFIVTTSFVKEEGVDIAPLSKSSDLQDEVPVLVIEINAFDEILIDGRQVDIAAVAANVETWKLEKDNPSVVITASTEASTAALVAVTDRVRLADIHRVTVAPLTEVSEVK